MLDRDPPRPDPGQLMPQRLGLPDAPEGIAHDGVDQVQDMESDSAVSFDPVARVIAELGVNDSLAAAANPLRRCRIPSEAVTPPWQGQSRDAVNPRFRALPYAVARVSAVSSRVAFLGDRSR